MKTLKELELNCTLIAEFKQHAFVTIKGHSANLFNRANIAKLFYNNKDTYYLYTKIINKDIYTYHNIGDAITRLNRSIYNIRSL